MNHLDFYQEKLELLKQKGQFRNFKTNVSQAYKIRIDGKEMINFASNDYLGFASDSMLVEEFFDLTPTADRVMSASSSRLLTGNFAQFEQLEQAMGKQFKRSVLLFNSGYHMNIGILPALCDQKTLIFADKLVHASLIDGIRLAGCHYVRFRHNDLIHLEELLEQYHGDEKIDRIIVVTESIFSMDGDETDLAALVQLKQKFSKTLLYVDEAHAIGVRGELGLGCVEQYQVIQEIDVIAGTFGKAMASIGAYIVCHEIIREYLINTMRPLIFSTALAPINVAWTHFIFNKMLTAQQRRENLQQCQQQIKQGLDDIGLATTSSSQIVPIVVGEAKKTIELAEYLQKQGFYILGVRPPTVPPNTSRLRLCLHSNLQKDDITELLLSIENGLGVVNG